MDRPIPFHVTTAGHAALVEALELDLFNQCEHRFEMIHRGLIVCQVCGYQPKLTRGASPSPQMKRA